MTNGSKQEQRREQLWEMLGVNERMLHGKQCEREKGHVYVWGGKCARKHASKPERNRVQFWIENAFKR